MSHPTNRGERRFVREVSRNKRRRIMKTWHQSSLIGLINNNMYWAGKQCVGHGNRCMCHYEKKLKRPKHSELKRIEEADMTL